jgi:hypothetical protein
MSAIKDILSGVREVLLLSGDLRWVADEVKGLSGDVRALDRRLSDDIKDLDRRLTRFETYAEIVKSQAGRPKRLPKS